MRGLVEERAGEGGRGNEGEDYKWMLVVAVVTGGFSRIDGQRGRCVSPTD